MGKPQPVSEEAAIAAIKDAETNGMMLTDEKNDG